MLAKRRLNIAGWLVAVFSLLSMTTKISGIAPDGVTSNPKFESGSEGQLGFGSKTAHSRAAASRHPVSAAFATPGKIVYPAIR